jgi:hypothetical protein
VWKCDNTLRIDSRSFGPERASHYHEAQPRRIDLAMEHNTVHVNTPLSLLKLSESSLRPVANEAIVNMILGQGYLREDQQRDHGLSEDGDRERTGKRTRCTSEFQCYPLRTMASPS